MQASRLQFRQRVDSCLQIGCDDAHSGVQTKRLLPMTSRVTTKTDPTQMSKLYHPLNADCHRHGPSSGSSPRVSEGREPASASADPETDPHDAGGTWSTAEVGQAAGQRYRCTNRHRHACHISSLGPRRRTRPEACERESASSRSARIGPSHRCGNGFWLHADSW